MPRVLLAAAFALLIATALPAATRKWTSSDGRFSTDAELVEQDEASVTLKKRSGETVTVPLDRLSEADHRFLRAQKKKPVAAKECLVVYTRDVQPFLVQYCAQCHNHEAAKDGYDVTSYAKLAVRGRTGVLVVPGKPDQSRLLDVMRGMSKSMPPSNAPQPAAEEIAKIAEWIEAGAPDDSAAAEKPKGRRSSRRTQ